MPRRKTVRLDLDDSQVKGLSLDQDVTIQIKGKVRELEASRMGFDFETPVPSNGKEKKVKIPAVASLELSSVEIVSAKSNPFTELAKDEDEEN